MPTYDRSGRTLSDILTRLLITISSPFAAPKVGFVFEDVAMIKAEVQIQQGIGIDKIL